MSLISAIDKILSMLHLNGGKSQKAETAEEIDLNALKEKYEPLLKTCIAVKPAPAASGCGALTHFGGRPSVPKNFEWPLFKTDSFDDPDGGEKERPLAFLAQFDCGELAQYDKENVLPHAGVLSFFYSVESNRWGFAPEDEGCSRVYWFENEKELITAEYPKELSQNYRFPLLALNLSVKDCYPAVEELPPKYDEKEYSEFYEAVNDGESVTKLLGWADVIQSEMATECELVTKGFNCGGNVKIPQKAIKEAELTAKNWRLLFQMGDLTCNGFELSFGDGGYIYFWIKKDDLAARRFNRAWLVLQCC